jgi:hypothetical protein
LDPNSYLDACSSFRDRGRYHAKFLGLATFGQDGDVYVVIEAPRGSRAKFAWDAKLETFALSKSLLTGLSYPHDLGPRALDEGR